MVSSQGSNDFFASVAGYEQFMGRYARPLAVEFVATVPLANGNSVLDIGCGPGALTAELVAKVGAESVSVIDPSPPFLQYCAAQYPGITAEVAKAEQIPFADASFDAVLSQLVIHFIGDLEQAGREIVRVTKPGGWVSVCTWNIDRMQKINMLPRAASAAGIEVPTIRVEAFGENGDVSAYLESIGLADVKESTISVSSTYHDFEELWSAYLVSIGPLGPWTVSQSNEAKAAIKRALFQIIDEPEGEFSLSAEARVATGRTPG